MNSPLDIDINIWDQRHKIPQQEETHSSKYVYVRVSLPHDCMWRAQQGWKLQPRIPILVDDNNAALTRLIAGLLRHDLVDREWSARRPEWTDPQQDLPRLTLAGGGFLVTGSCTAGTAVTGRRARCCCLGIPATLHGLNCSWTTLNKITRHVHKSTISK